jgi:hypothetical protein
VGRVLTWPSSLMTNHRRFHWVLPGFLMLLFTALHVSWGGGGGGRFGNQGVEKG